VSLRVAEWRSCPRTGVPAGRRPGMRRRVPGRRNDGSDPIAVRLAAYHRGHARATSPSVADDGRWRRAMAHSVSPRRTTYTVDRGAGSGGRTRARCSVRAVTLRPTATAGAVAATTEATAEAAGTPSPTTSDTSRRARPGRRARPMAVARRANAAGSHVAERAADSSAVRTTSSPASASTARASPSAIEVEGSMGAFDRHRLLVFAYHRLWLSRLSSGHRGCGRRGRP
jgi:hypothetical protein